MYMYTIQPSIKVLLHFFLINRFQSIRSTVRAPVFGRHQFSGTSEHFGKAHGSLLSGWRNYNYTACCWFPTSINILILPSQFWQISFESYWLHWPNTLCSYGITHVSMCSCTYCMYMPNADWFSLVKSNHPPFIWLHHAQGICAPDRFVVVIVILLFLFWPRNPILQHI